MPTRTDTLLVAFMFFAALFAGVIRYLVDRAELFDFLWVML